MAYVVKTVTVKPAQAQWFGQFSPAVNQRYVVWARAQTGVLSTIGRISAPNTFETITVFADQAAYDAFQTAVAANPDAQARAAYATAQGFQVTTSVIG